MTSQPGCQPGDRTALAATGAPGTRPPPGDQGTATGHDRDDLARDHAS